MTLGKGPDAAAPRRRFAYRARWWILGGVAFAAALGLAFTYAHSAPEEPPLSYPRTDPAGTVAEPGTLKLSDFRDWIDKDRWWRGGSMEFVTRPPVEYGSGGGACLIAVGFLEVRDTPQAGADGGTLHIGYANDGVVREQQDAFEHCDAVKIEQRLGSGPDGLGYVLLDDPVLATAPVQKFFFDVAFVSGSTFPDSIFITDKPITPGSPVPEGASVYEFELTDFSDVKALYDIGVALGG